ncbi:hypothetical protein JXM83_06080 [Candidatus Woesearchaeota archaeon]|nr:hypothetical protein [Candidatus Woesearchaeota archaeon]
MKKGMVQSQAIMYVLGMIIVAAILIFGVKSIGSFKKQADSVQMVKFKGTLLDSVSTISTEYNSVEPVTVVGVPGINEICFIGGSGTADLIPDDEKYFLIYDSVSSGAEENTFLLSDKGLEEAFNIGKIEIDSGFLCVKSKSNKYEFVLTGLGDAAKISLD